MYNFDYYYFINNLNDTTFGIPTYLKYRIHTIHKSLSTKLFL